MVFHCRCFSFLLEQDREIEYETPTQNKSTSTFHTAASDFNPPKPIVDTKPSEILNLAEKQSNLRIFNLSELRAATDNFCTVSKIGEGGFGSVYKGVISSLGHPCYQIPVAVKRAKGLLKRQEEWETEINVLGVVEHPNLVKLIGYCAEDNESSTELFLVYEYMVNKSVSDHLYAQSKTPLSWNMRLKIAQDAARGLTYLHEEMDFQVILRDLKPSNILLDDQWNAKLADFGLALLLPQEQLTQVSFVGTMAYAAPEYISVGLYTSKSDVWSYGVFLYELITGRRPLDRQRPQNEQKLLEWVKPYLESTRFQEIIDPRLKGKYSLESAQKLSNIASMCLFSDPSCRPKMSEVLKMVDLIIWVSSQAISPDNKTSNDNKKDSTGNQRRLSSCLRCFK